MATCTFTAGLLGSCCCKQNKTACQCSKWQVAQSAVLLMLLQVAQSQQSSIDRYGCDVLGNAGLASVERGAGGMWLSPAASSVSLNDGPAAAAILPYHERKKSNCETRKQAHPALPAVGGFLQKETAKARYNHCILARTPTPVSVAHWECASCPQRWLLRQQCLQQGCSAQERGHRNQLQHTTVRRTDR